MSDAIRDIEYGIFESQSEIIRLQSEAIIGLISLIAQHKDIDDMDFMPIKKKIDDAAQIRAEHGL